MRNARKIKTFLSFSLHFHNGVPSTAGKRYEKNENENENKKKFV